ncbi:MAG: hypothetical protein L6R45_29185 [Anaerolineae bacterium]|nr:hypothetical protein [Anaerolineae bacterium]
MCDQLIPLAQSSDYRHVYVCEHGMIHLAWDHSTVYLPAAKLEELVRFVNRGINSTHARLSEGRYHLALTANGYYQLWMGSAGLLLSAVDSLIFVDLLQVALRQWQSQLTPRPPESANKPGRRYEPSTLASLNNTFSTN